LHLVGPTDQHFLSEARCKSLPVGQPPLPVKVFGHHLIDDDIIVYRYRAAFLPQTFGRRTDIGGYAAKVLGQLVAHPLVFRLRKLPAVVIEKRQQDLDEIHGDLSEHASYLHDHFSVKSFLHA